MRRVSCSLAWSPRCCGSPLRRAGPEHRHVAGRPGRRHRQRRHRMAPGRAGRDRPRQCPRRPRRRDGRGRPAAGPLPPRRRAARRAHAPPRSRPPRRCDRRPAATTRSGGWRPRARVKITTATDTARGDRAVYDIDQAVLVLTGPRPVADHAAAGHHRPRQPGILVAEAHGGRPRRRRGDRPAENRRVAADTLVAYFLEGAGAPRPRPPPPPRRAPAPGEQEPPGAGRMDRVEAFGNVEIRTATEVVRGDRGVYSARRPAWPGCSAMSASPAATTRSTAGKPS